MSPDVPDVQGDWTVGLWWCYGEHPAQYDEIERAGYAVSKCCLALETHIREMLFEPLRRIVTQTESRQLPDNHAALKSFLQGAYIDLGTMLEALAFADPTRPGAHKRLWDLLSKRSSKPRDLQRDRYREICLIRNPCSHESRRAISGATIELARRCAELCQKFYRSLSCRPFFWFPLSVRANRFREVTGVSNRKVIDAHFQFCSARYRTARSSKLETTEGGEKWTILMDNSRKLNDKNCGLCSRCSTATFSIARAGTFWGASRRQASTLCTRSPRSEFLQSRPLCDSARKMSSRDNEEYGLQPVLRG